MDSDELLSYLQRRYPNRNKLQVFDLQDITSGWETEIFSVDLGWITEDESIRETLVVRMYPNASTINKANHEYTTMKRLYTTGYPVPKMHLIETDVSQIGRPFIIMDKIEGVTLSDHQASSQEAYQEYLPVFCKLFVDLHNLDWTSLVSNPQAYRTDDPYFFVRSALSRFDAGLVQYGKQELEPILNWLQTRVDDVPCTRPSFIHLDFHHYNILIDQNGRPFVIDWAGSQVQDSRIDLAWTLLLTGTYGTKNIRDDILHGYQNIAGMEVKHLDYFEVIAILRRLFDISVSLGEGANELGMREGAVEMMKESVDHIRRVHDRLGELTNISISEVEQLIERLS